MKKIFTSIISVLFITVLQAQPNFDLVGYATENGGTTGGEGGTTVTVSSLSDFKSYAESDNKYIIKVDGTISNGSSGAKISIGSNTSIIGLGSTAFLQGIGLEIKNNSNIIIQNVKMTFVGLSNPSGVNQGDLISIHTSGKNIWIDHCEFYSENPDVQTDKDKYDGLLDIKGQTGYITISWCYFHDHWKCGLVGAADSDLYDERLVTYHHNYYKNIKYRMPMYRGATGHFFNNYLTNVEDASEIRAGTCVRVERNYYEDFHYAIYTPSDAKGYTERIDNYLDGSQSRAFPGNCTANIPYDYSSVLTTNAQDVKEIVMQYAGVGVMGDDCNGEMMGGAYIDECGTCVGGSTGLEPCYVDCNGVEDGTAALDECGICSGGNTGVKPCPGALQGEDFCLADGAAESKNSGFIGDGYANLDNANGSSASWYIVSDSEQAVSVEIRYSNGGSSARGMELSVNGTAQTAIAGNTTSNWETWTSEIVSLNFKQGVNAISLTATDDGGGPNIDTFIFKTSGLSAGSCDADCNGDIGGSAYYDDCNNCVGGNTGIDACVKDCNAEWGGTAYTDDCGDCVEGSTGKSPCSTEPVFVPLKKGWNLIGCPFKDNTAIETVLSSIWEKVELVKDFNQFYDSSQDPALNSLKELKWGHGYFIKVSEDCTLEW